MNASIRRLAPIKIHTSKARTNKGICKMCKVVSIRAVPKRTSKLNIDPI